MWQIQNNPLRRDVIQTTIEEAGNPLTYEAVLHLWRDDTSFRQLFIDWLVNLPFEAIRWETPALTIAQLTRPFECVALDSPRLIRRPNQRAFANQFHTRRRGNIVVFQNLGGDATMLVPRPNGDKDYCHLLSFMRQSPTETQHELWQNVGDRMLRLVNDSPRWLSTAGGGVAWLHVRIDSRPKYYHYHSYRQP